MFAFYLPLALYVHKLLASYTNRTITLAELDKSKVTGIEQVDTLQDGVNNVAAGQVGQGGLLQPLGDAVSKEGFNRTERQGKDDSGGYTPADLPGASAVGSAAGNVSEGGKAVAGKVGEGLSGVGGLLGGGSKGQQTDQKQ